ncbi:hypothetical protein [Prosthecobacter sp. SYSU 5D2]|uniref:hypothetical protein n=1 Tax=Prosthecobacter sp. SYSU 5D2 TaxID=3134134 RepID=UPI0031FF0271
MQAGGEALPCHLFQVALQAGDEPDITVEGDACGIALVIEKGDVGKADIALPGIRDGQGDFVENVGVRGFGKDGLGGDGLGPVDERKRMCLTRRIING